MIVYVVGFTEAGQTETPAAQVAQRGRKFVPDLVAVTVGQSVNFPNQDAFLHNVFSQYSARKFDLGSFKKGESKSKSFDTSGVIDVYCNIHPEMAATILVLPNTRHTRTKPDGSYVIDGVPAGTWTVFAYARRVANVQGVSAIRVTDQGCVVGFALRGAARPTAHMAATSCHITHKNCN